MNSDQRSWFLPLLLSLAVAAFLPTALSAQDGDAAPAAAEPDAAAADGDAADADGDDSAMDDRDWTSIAPSEGVTVTTKASNIKSGSSVRVTVENSRGEPIYLMGCRPLQPEWFDAERWQALPGEPCKTEGTAQQFDPGTKDFQVAAAGRNRMLFRATMTYGVGCTPGVPLSAASCRDFATISTGKVQVNPAD